MTPANIVPAKATFSFLSSVAWEPEIQDLVWPRLSLDNVVLYLRVWGLKEKQSYFVSVVMTHWSHPMVSPFAVVSLQCPDRLIFWKQQFGRPRTGQFLGMCKRRSVIVQSLLIPVVLSSRSLKATSPPQPSPALASSWAEEGRWWWKSQMWPNLPGSSLVRGHLAPFL